MMNSRSKSLLIIILVLLIANLGLQFRNSKRGNAGFDDRMFAVIDTSGIEKIKIGELTLQKNAGWKIDDRPADPAFVDHLKNVLLRVRVKKPIGNLDEGMEIVVNDNDAFKFSSNATKTKTFFSRNGKGYEVEIPGFTDYLGGIFELNKDQWRDRLVYNGSWRTIQNLKMDYRNSDDKDFEISFEKDFFSITGIQQIDTAQLMSYLNQFQYFQANERISSGRIAEMDSLVNTEPAATLRIQDINSETPITLTFFPKRSQDQYNLALDSNGEMIAIDAPRAERILRERGAFRYKKSN